MATGILIYCFDSEKVNYHRTTNFCIELIKKNLGFPVTVVTNDQTKNKIKGYDSLVIIENQKNNSRYYKDRIIPWYNLERCDAYEHSPYETTILMDSDYFAYTNNLYEITKSKYEFLLHNQVHDLTNRNSFEYKTSSMLPLVWATVTIFRKTPLVRRIFDMIIHVKRNYNYFLNLYRIDFQNFRNDYAFAIALNQIGGHSREYFIPAKMAMLPGDTQILKIDQTGMTYKYNNHVNFLQDQDVHVLDKEIPFDE